MGVKKNRFPVKNGEITSLVKLRGRGTFLNCITRFMRLLAEVCEDGDADEEADDDEELYEDCKRSSMEILFLKAL